MKEIVRYILETVVCSGILYGAYLLFLRNCTGYLAARLCLTGSLLAAALIPLLRIPVWPGKVIYATAGTPAKTTFTAPSVSAAAFDYEAAIWIVYGCGVLLLLSSMFRQALLIRRLRRHSTQERIGRIVLVRPTAQIASFSFFRTIYISRSVAEKDIAAIFAHEKSHVIHRHSLERIVMESLKALLWWNPFAWLAARALTEVEEFEADRDVLAEGHDTGNYLKTIFTQQFGYSPDVADGLSNSLTNTLTKKRIQMMTFTEDRAGRKKGWMHNPNSNTYIIVYSTVMVVIVATLLAVASLSLQKRQAENELQEKKSNILQSLGYSPDENPQEFDRALADFDNQVKSFVLDADGVKTETPSKEVFAMLATNQNIRDNYDAKRLILFQTEDGRVVIPLIGMGLWGDIWGYVALEKDMDTVSGIVMAHKGETPGLGAEIATPKFQAHFAGKKLFKSGEFVSVSLRKGGAKGPEHEVDGISGGTKTSDGVTAMLRDCLSAYLPYFESQHQAAAQSAPAAANEAASSEVSNQQNVNESHE